MGHVVGTSCYCGKFPSFETPLLGTSHALSSFPPTTIMALRRSPYKRPYYRRRRFYSGARRATPYKLQLPRAARPPTFSTPRLDRIHEICTLSAAGPVFRTLVVSLKSEGEAYLSGIRLEADFTVHATSGLRFWIGVVDVLRSDIADGWRNGMPTEIFGERSFDGLFPLPDRSQVMVAGSRRGRINILNPSVPNSEQLKLWVPLKVWTGLDRRGARTPRTDFKVIVVMQSMADYPEGASITTDLLIKAYFRNTTVA